MTSPSPTEHTPVPWDRPLAVCLALFTLVTFTVSQSLYEMLAGNRELLALRLEGNLQLLELIAVFNWLPALALFAVWWVLARLHRSAARVFLGLVCFSLILVFFFQLDNAYFLQFWRGFAHSYWLWVLPALGLSLAFLAFERTAYAFVRVLSPVIVIFPLLFLARTWAGTSTYVPPTVSAAQSGASAEESRRLPPIVVIVLDELSLPVLLDETGRIDASRYPNFHALAQQSHWFRNATANADHTTRSLPALLTGTLPLPDAAPTFRDYPENVFTWLQPHYQIYVWETWTHFCVPRVFHCMGALHTNTSGRADLVRDILTLFAERLLPGGIAGDQQEDQRTWALLRDPHRLMQLRLAHFESLLRGIAELPAGRPFLVFFHHDLPHSPYWLSPEGELREVDPAKFDSRLTGNTAALSLVLERYRRQVTYVDSSLGRFFAALRARGLYDDSVVIVTSDHGVSYRAEAPGRNFSGPDGQVVNADLLLAVPLLIKLPGQQKGEVHDREVQLIDVVPTLAEALPLRLPWQANGRNLLNDSGAPRVKVAFDRQGQRYEFPADLGLRALEYRLEPLAEARKSAGQR